MRSPEAALLGAPRERLLALPRNVSAGAAVLAASLPIVFLHADYQPSVSVSGATLKLSDAAILVTALTALIVAVRGGELRRLRAGLAVWSLAVLFLAWVVVGTFYPLLWSRPYAWRTHFVTAGEFCEYALLAPSVALLVRRRADGVLALGVLVLWTMIADGVGIAQWFGWSGVGGWGQGNRQPSFLGTHDFAALSAMTLGIGFVMLLFGVQDRKFRRGAWLAVVAGVVGFVLGGASAGVVGLVLAALAAVLVAARRSIVTRRTVVAVAAATAIASAGVLVLRAGDFGSFFRFAGIEQSQQQHTIQTYSQRTLLAYIGVRIWLHHPILGVGWQESTEPAAFERELPAAHRRFSNVAAISFPSSTRRYGVQILYVQLLSDLGIVGFTLFATFAVAAVWAGIKDAFRLRPEAAFGVTLGLFWLLLALGLWSAEGLVAGIPLEALTWLGVGVVARQAANG